MGNRQKQKFTRFNGKRMQVSERIGKIFQKGRNYLFVSSPYQRPILTIKDLAKNLGNVVLKRRGFPYE
jgi:hypothetical protein